MYQRTMGKKTTQNMVFLLVGGLLAVAGFWLRFADLGVTNFQNDEFFHVEAAEGYLKTGNYVLWDFLEQKPGAAYQRAWIYTWQVAQSFKLFGVNEFSGRLPSVIWGVLLLPLVGWLAWRVSSSRLVGVFSMLLVTFDQSLIWASRTCRMYSLFIFLVTLMMWCVIEAFKKPWRKWLIQPVWYAAAGVIFVLAYLAHESALALIAGGVGSIIWLVIDASVRKTPERKQWWLVSAVAVLGIGIVLLVDRFTFPVLPHQFFTFRLNPNWDYGLYMFNQMRWAFLGWPLLGVAAWGAMRFKHTGIAILLGTILPIITFFVFIADRYAEKKYILFILPITLICTAYGLERAIWLGIPALVGKLPRWLMISLITAVFISIGSIPSWPGLPANTFFQTARADERPKNSKLHNFKAAYELVEAQLAVENRPVVIQGLQTFYWSRPMTQFFSMKTSREFTPAELEDIYSHYPHGFVVFPKYKSYHLRSSVLKFVHHHMTRLKGTRKTKVEVYQW